jgi:uncharacterized protein (TIGR00299 family) protein
MSQRVGYFQCVGGASGDMILGSLVDCGLPIDTLRSVVSALGIEGVELSSAPGTRGAVTGTQVTVSVQRDDERRHSISDFVEMVQRSRLPGPVVASATRILRRLGQAEATVHGVEPDQVHLHELGSLDTVVDVTCAVAGLAEMGVEAVYSSPIPTGSGVVRTAHGMTPVPAPATLALLTSSGAPIASPPGGVQDAGEMVTPTGAALLTGLATFEQPEMTVDVSGYGLGSRDPAEYPNALGLWIGPQTASSSLVLLETNIDDESPQVLAYVVERLLALGARDAWLTGAQMKKGRMGQVLSALVGPALEQRAADLIMAETTTLGVRSSRVRRHEAGREQVIVQTSFGSIPVKVKKLGGVAIEATPEYEVAKRIALEKRVPLRQVLAAARQAAGLVIEQGGPSG